MFIEQVKFYNRTENEWLAGIRVGDTPDDNDFIICGCCGGVFPLDEFDDPDRQIIPYEDWVDITEFITGDE